MSMGGYLTKMMSRGGIFDEDPASGADSKGPQQAPTQLSSLSENEEDDDILGRLTLLKLLGAGARAGAIGT